MNSYINEASEAFEYSRERDFSDVDGEPMLIARSSALIAIAEELHGIREQLRIKNALEIYKEIGGYAGQLSLDSVFEDEPGPLKFRPSTAQALGIEEQK
ncbi:hypothetical protein [Bifidobacterium sp.]|uniref:hypothetical protein n=1 Tax=Bifidobacterium sp. TaxID=41200 RepID=UPI0039EAB203